MKNRLRIALAASLTVLLTGCLEFERQCLSFRHDAAADTLYIFQDYQGIFGADDPAQLTEGEKEQMASVIKGERTFFFANWLAEFNRKPLAEKQEAPMGELDADESYEAALRSLLAVALANIRVENVGFYLSRDGRLCGAQRVTVKNVSKVVAVLNHWLPGVLRQEGNKWDKTKEQRRNLYAFAGSGQDVLRLDGNRMEIRWPATAEEFVWFRDRSPQGRAFREGAGEMAYANRMIVLTLGKPGAESVSLTLPVSERAYSTNALAEAKKYEIKGVFNAASAAKTFLGGPGPSAIR
jgi:hypothetical protein